MKCKNCKHEISNSASHCSYCGNNIENSNKLKKRIIIISLATVFLVIAIALIIILTNISSGKEEIELNEKGTLYENASDFDINADTQHASPLSEAFLNNVTYEIIEIDEERMIATIVVAVPDISQELSVVIDEVVEENAEMQYDQLLSDVKEKLQAILEDDGLPKKETTLELSIKSTDEGYKMVPNEEWNNIIYGDLERLYLETFKNLIGGMTNENPK